MSMSIPNLVENLILYKMVYLVSTFVVWGKLETPTQFPSSGLVSEPSDPCINLIFAQEIIHMENSNICKNQLILSILSASKSVNKKLRNSVTLVFCIFYLNKNFLQKIFFTA